MEREIKEALKHLKDLLDIQGGNGNWDHDPYMFGLYNGMILAKSLMDNEEPVFRDAPEKWTGKTKEERAVDKLREANPILLKAWEEYKIMEALIGGTENGPTNH